MTLKAFLIMLAVFGSPAIAAQEGALRGTAEAGYLSTKPRSETLFNPSGALIDSKVRRATAAVNVRAKYAGSNVGAILNGWIEYRKEQAGNGADTRFDVPEAYLEYTLSEETTMAAGATIARWGTGYVWNPANPLLDPDANNTSRARPYRRDGDPFARIETAFGKDSAGIYVARFRQNDPLLSPLKERERAFVGRYQHVTDSGDVTGFLSFARHEQFGGVAASATVSDQLELHGELGVRTRRRAPQIRSTDIQNGNGQTRRLFIWDFEPRNSLTPAALIGGQYTFENRVNTIVEYFYNGNGFSRSEYKDLRDAAEGSTELLGIPALDEAGRGFLLDANRLVGRLRRHYLFFRVASDEIARNTDLHYYLRAGLEDRSLVQGVFLRHSFTQRARAQISAEIYQGPAGAETRLIPLKYGIETTLSIDF